MILLILFSSELKAKSLESKSFGDVKPLLAEIYLPYTQTFYCGCEYQKKSIKKCPLNTNKYKKRKKRLEWEHVVPAHAFGHSFKEWREANTLCPKKNKKYSSKRRCARKLNQTFRAMEADLHNLVPSVGSINALRSNYSFAEIDTKIKPLCSNGFRRENRKVMPPENRKGDIARIYFYMDEQYPGHGVVSNKNRKLFQAWDSIDPVDIYECAIYHAKVSKGAHEIRSLKEKCQKLKE
ncbi:MAG: endonuclease I [Halobacteriovoraceae bacterium]|nr:endonuclease I [Halobacteriovoraceae bacterium]|tara:strand:- start:39399 stop:40109 length:711 start_codon:yes stop_codon:yes gene_type:complete